MKNKEWNAHDNEDDDEEEEKREKSVKTDRNGISKYTIRVIFAVVFLFIL